MPPIRRLAIATGVLLALTAAGTAGYVVIGGMTPLDALYMTVITLSTVGYSEVQPLGPGGRLFTIFLIAGGLGTVLYATVAVAEFFLEGHLREVLERRAMTRRIETTRDHVIVCGYGRLGREVASQLHREGRVVVVIDPNPALAERLEREGHLFLTASALEDGILGRAGVERAAAVVAATPSDADNVYIALAAREAHPGIAVHARGQSEAGIRYLRLAGATQVVSPYQLGGRRIAQAIVRPAVVDFIELASPGTGGEIDLEQIAIHPGCRVCGLPLRELPQHGVRVSVVAIKRADRASLIRPTAGDTIEAGDILVVVGDPENLGRLAELAAA